MIALSRQFRVTLPWELYADDMVVIAETEDDLITPVKGLMSGRMSWGNRGTRVYINNTLGYNLWCYSVPVVALHQG